MLIKLFIFCKKYIINKGRVFISLKNRNTWIFKMLQKIFNVNLKISYCNKVITKRKFMKISKIKIPKCNILKGLKFKLNSKMRRKRKGRKMVRNIISNIFKRKILIKIKYRQVWKIYLKNLNRKLKNTQKLKTLKSK